MYINVRLHAHMQRAGFSEGMVFELRPPSHERATHWERCGTLSGQRHSKCQGPKIGMKGECWQDGEKTRCGFREVKEEECDPW